MPPLRNILVCYPLKPASLLTKLKQHFAHVDYFPVRGGIDYSNVEPPQPTQEAYERADVLLTFNMPTNLHDIKQMPRLRLLQLVGSATHQVTGSAFVKSAASGTGNGDRKPFYISNTAGIHTSCIGEHVLMTTMMVFRKMNETNDICRGEHRWATPQEIGGDDLYIRELRGSTVGILGYGNLGREIARLFSCFGCDVIVGTRTGERTALDWLPVPGTGDPSGSIPSAWYSTSRKDSLHEMLARCDVLVNCLPVSNATVGLLGAEEFKACKKGETVFVNVGRGQTVVQDELVRALKDGTIAGAALDVTDPEPLPKGHELYKLKNVVLTPHVSWASSTNFVRAVDVLLQNKARLEKDDDVKPFNNIPY